MLDIVNKNAFETRTLPNNLVLMFCLLYMMCEICVFAKIWFVKISTRIANYTNYNSLN